MKCPKCKQVMAWDKKDNTHCCYLCEIQCPLCADLLFYSFSKGWIKCFNCQYERNIFFCLECSSNNTTEKHLNEENGKFYIGCLDCNATWQEEV